MSFVQLVLCYLSSQNCLTDDVYVPSPCVANRIKSRNIWLTCHLPLIVATIITLSPRRTTWHQHALKHFLLNTICGGFMHAKDSPSSSCSSLPYKFWLSSTARGEVVTLGNSFSVICILSLTHLCCGVERGGSVRCLIWIAGREWWLEVVECYNIIIYSFRNMNKGGRKLEKWASDLYQVKRSSSNDQCWQTNQTAKPLCWRQNLKETTKLAVSRKL